MSGRRQDLDDIPVGADWTLTVRMPAGTDTSAWTVKLYFLEDVADNLAEAIGVVSGGDVSPGEGDGNRDIVITVTNAKTVSLGRSKPWYAAVRENAAAYDRLVYGIADLTMPRAKDA